MVTMSTVPSGSRDYNDRVTALANSFTKAVVDGDCIQCRTIATELGKMRPQLEVTQLQSGETLSIQVILQRQGVERATITLQITSNMTVKHLKAMMDRDYKLPMKLQCWIYGRQLLGDDVTIEEMGVKDGAVFGLYVMSEKFASLPPPPPQVEIPASVQQPVLQIVEELANPEPVPEVPLQTEPAAPVPVREITWACSACTYANQPTRPSCEMCGSDRPDDFILPDDYQPSAEERRRLEQEEMMTTLFQQTQLREEEEMERYRQVAMTVMTAMNEQSLVRNTEPFECKVCFTDVQPEDGVILRECLHEFCQPCLAETIMNSEGAEVKCPYADDDYQCDMALQDREISALVDEEEYNKYLARGVRIAEGQAKNSFHCKTPNCQGWCVFEDEVNFFNCPACEKINCLTCNAIHEGQNCQEYQDQMKREAEKEPEIRATLEGIQEMLRRGEAMNCPGCGVLLQKKEGCDWMRCSMCLTELCWATRGPRWGPRGNGDTSAGCQCGLNGRRCAPHCGNCH